MRSDIAFFSAADIGRRFLGDLASDLLSAVAAAAVLDLPDAATVPAAHRRLRGGARRRSAP